MEDIVEEKNRIDRVLKNVCSRFINCNYSESFQRTIEAVSRETSLDVLREEHSGIYETAHDIIYSTRGQILEEFKSRCYRKAGINESNLKERKKIHTAESFRTVAFYLRQLDMRRIDSDSIMALSSHVVNSLNGKSNGSSRLSYKKSRDVVCVGDCNDLEKELYKEDDEEDMVAQNGFDNVVKIMENVS